MTAPPASAAAGDDLLREASDPTTPGERLRALLMTAHGRPLPEALVMWSAAYRNPNLPLTRLRQALLTPDLHRVSDTLLAAWHNPSTRLLLLQEPLPAFAAAAHRALRRLGDIEGHSGPGRADDLPRTVSAWAAFPACPGAPAARQFARHLADLFDLPWPD
jgi:hypothetical protein